MWPPTTLPQPHIDGEGMDCSCRRAFQKVLPVGKRRLSRNAEYHSAEGEYSSNLRPASLGDASDVGRGQPSQKFLRLLTSVANR